MKYLRQLRTVHIILIVSLVTLALVVFRYFNPNLGFTYFEPSYLPEGISIKQKRIVIDNGTHIQVGQNFRTENWVYSINQHKVLGVIEPTAKNFNHRSVSPTCDRRLSPQQTNYRICHWIDYDRIGVYGVTFIKSGTYIESKIPVTRDRIISLQEIDTYVDSFQQKNTIGLPILRLEGFGLLSPIKARSGIILTLS